MTTRVIAAGLLFLVLVSPAAGQRRRRVLSPEIGDDGRVTFRLAAANAEEVEVDGQWAAGSAPMTKDGDGLWHVTLGPIPPGVWEYRFRVDGLAMIDPGNGSIKPMRSPRSSILHIPGDPPLNHDFQDVPHGTVHLHTYDSQSLGRLRELAVYTPPGYGDDQEASFPTLYLQHGSGDNHATWTVHGKAHWIVDNLIAQGRAKPMVIVMMDGHAATAGARGGGNTEFFEKDLLHDVMPLVRANYRVQSGAASQAIAGLSMGGGQALSVGLRNTDRFSWIGAFSSAVPRGDGLSELLADASKINGQLQLLWVGCGRDDSLLDRNLTLIAQLKERGIEHQWHLTEGNHSWPIWRIYLADFVPNLFR